MYYATLIVNNDNDVCNVNDDNAIGEDDDTAKGARPVVTWLVMTYHGAEVETTLIRLALTTIPFVFTPDFHNNNNNSTFCFHTRFSQQ